MSSPSGGQRPWWLTPGQSRMSMLSPSLSFASTSVGRSENSGGDQNHVLGIDLGTAFSRAAVFMDGEAFLVPTGPDNSSKVKSQVCSQALSRRLRGPSVDLAADVELQDLCQGSMIFDVKRLLGRRDTDPVLFRGVPYWPFRIEPVPGGSTLLLGALRKGAWRMVTVEDSVAAILTRMRDFGEQQLGPVRDAVLTVPVAFSRIQVASLEHACAVAGLNVLQFIPEPCAAALLYVFQQQLKRNVLQLPEKIRMRVHNEAAETSATVASAEEAQVQNTGNEFSEHTFVVVNVGAGFCDVAVATTTGGLCQILALAGDVIGSTDMFCKLAERALRKFKAQGMEAGNSATSRCMLRFMCEEAMLARQAGEPLELNLPDYDGRSIVVSEEEILQDASSMLRTVEKLIEQAIGTAGVLLSEIDDVVLCGGGTNVSFVRENLGNIFNLKMFYDFGFDPSEIGVRGAAVSGALAGQARDPTLAGLDLKMLHVLPHGLGVAVSGGGVVHVIQKNSSIPDQQDITLTTCHDDQKTALIQIFEGESSECAKCTLLGSFVLNPIPPRPKGKPIIHLCMVVSSTNCLRILAAVYLPEEASPVTTPLDITLPCGSQALATRETIIGRYGGNIDVEALLLEDYN